MRLILLRYVLSVLDVTGLIDPFTLRYGHLASLPSSLAPCCEAMDTGPGEFHIPQEVVQQHQSAGFNHTASSPDHIAMVT